MRGLSRRGKWWTGKRRSSHRLREIHEKRASQNYRETQNERASQCPQETHYARASQVGGENQSARASQFRRETQKEGAVLICQSADRTRGVHKLYAPFYFYKSISKIFQSEYCRRVFRKFTSEEKRVEKLSLFESRVPPCGTRLSSIFFVKREIMNKLEF